MFLHPGIIALTLGSVVILILVLSASALGIKIIRRWDIDSSSEEQLSLERKTYLISTLVHYALAFEILSIFLFIYTAEDIHPLLVGAMCATGSLNANIFGFPTLYVKIFSFFSSASWIAINYLDNRAEYYPLIKTKYRLLIGISLILIIEFVLQIQYFVNINPDVITSCCGVMFGEKGEGIASSLASLPVKPAMTIFYSLLIVTIAGGVFSYKNPRRPFTLLFSIFAFVFFIVSLTSIISFISLYFYQIPTHHCPFDILQKEYYYIGYPIYVFLFAGSFLGIITGVVEPFKRIPSLTQITLNAQKKWILYSIIALTIFALIASAPIVLSPLKLN
jgi:hypothetical protein